MSPMGGCWLALLGVGVLGCGAPKAPPPASEVAVPKAVVAPPPIAPPTASAPKASAAEDGEPMTPKPPAKATPGRIACGAASCNAEFEICCNGTHCMGRAEVSAWVEAHPDAAQAGYHATMGDGCPVGEHWSYQAFGCDDAGDCLSGQACCDVGRGTELTTAVCADSPCYQVCSGSGGCTPGYRCELGPGDNRGVCRFEATAVSCADQTCRGDRLICCEGRPDDIDDGTAVAAQCWPWGEYCDGFRLECRRHADCGDGRQCCGLNMGETMCLPSCVVQLGDRPACETLADCPREAHLIPKSCEGDDIKYCEY